MIAELTGQFNSGSLTAAEQAVTIKRLFGAGTFGVDLSGTFTATLVVEGTLGDPSSSATTWRTLYGRPITGGGAAASFTAAGLYLFSVAGLHAVRVRCSAYTSGTVVVLVHAAPGDSAGLASGGFGTSGAAIVQGSYTDKSGSITTGGTAQTLAAANTARGSLLVQNISVESLYLRWTGTATNNSGTPNSLELLPGAVYECGPFVSTQAVSIIGATTGSKFFAQEGA
jgi:hypothetical protein